MQQYQLNNEDELSISYFVQQLIPKHFQEYMIKYASTPSSPEDGLAKRIQAEQRQQQLWFEELNRQLNCLLLEIPKK